MTISPARWPDDREIVLKLFIEYQGWLGEACCFQDFEAELSGLPGAYRQPSGVLLLAREGRDVVGVIGVLPFTKGEQPIRVR